MESQVNVSQVMSGLLQSNVLNRSEGVTSKDNLSDAVQQFEAFFIQSMLKSMRSASLASGLLESDKSNFFRDWHDQQLAKDLGSKETFAVAKLLRGQFGGKPSQGTPVASLAPTAIFRSSPHSSSGSSVIPKNTTLKQTVTDEITATAIKPNSLSHSTPEKFIQEVYPHAQRAASKLNVSADVLVAIAALETGWGLHTPKSNNTQDSFNYFGIKANNWKGPEVSSVTKEFDGNKMIQMQDSFRAYTSPSESFDDFANLLLESPRYQEALKFSHDAKTFVEELQKAGYATDPNYAKKVISILDGSILQNAISSNTVISKNESEVTAKLESANRN